MRAPHTLHTAAVVLLLCLCACAEERSGASLEAGGEVVEREAAAALPGRWVTADEQGVLTFYRDGQVTLELTGAMQERAEPLTGTYAPLGDGRIRLDFPTFSPVFVTLEDGDELSFVGPSGLVGEGVTYRKVSDLPQG